MKATSKGMIVIADDLTGANDTGVQFARQGMHTEVLLNDAALNATATADIIVVDTNSRAVPAPEAYARVQQAAQKAAAAGFAQYYKKLDSTLRGNVGMEIKAILDLNLHDFALVMPAFPKNGRITVGGNYLLNGAPLSTTEIARDPKTPVYETMLPELLRKQTGFKVGHIDFADISQGQEGIVQALRRHLNDGCRIISSDAWQDEHFLIVAQAAASLSEKILWSGSAGLAEVLPQLFHWAAEPETRQPAFVIAGSVSSVTRGQVEQLVASGYEMIELEVAGYLSWQAGQPHPTLQQVQQALSAGRRIVLVSGYKADTVQQTQTAGEKLGMSLVAVGEKVAQILGWIGAEILRAQDISGVVLTGGDTAVAVCNALGVTGIRVLEEVTPAIPLGAMTTREGKQLLVVTKAGAFGAPDALVKAVKKLEQRR
ncbi:four-carbon acid sugar kinase family protein [Sporomusa sphaeroides]|uniref:four-carbon acid sugar kinase family protein n=1 Tax=Sporomusa sphaeroides TaxID=47679 RepID=UPI00202E710D|nr:four-carbon acid sugar kinase family protein [Sporomusa sphaeroides]MCM0757530.1 four-carbon acid sugar kinase family protein [Sporomusa sphaeroides DSM 2875]HML32995.1 four-carbon acid sugar kinase family protein [Sporomusa sphaeroides]